MSTAHSIRMIHKTQRQRDVLTMPQKPYLPLLTRAQGPGENSMVHTVGIVPLLNPTGWVTREIHITSFAAEIMS